MKKKLIIILFIIDIMIILLGIFYSIYSFIFHMKFIVLNTVLPSYIIGILTLYLGIRYLFSLNKLKVNISSQDKKFLWKNFKHIKE